MKLLKLKHKILIAVLSIVMVGSYAFNSALAYIYNPTDFSSGGAVTSITAGTGLTGSPNPITSTGTLSLNQSYVPYTAVVATSGGAYSSVATAVTAVCGAGGGSVYVKDGTYTETTAITGCSNLRITLSQGTTVQINQTSTGVTTFFSAPSGSSRIIIEGGKWLQTSGTIGSSIAFDMSNLSNTYIQNTRVETFNTAVVYNDTANTTFYNSINNAQFFDDNNCVAYLGTQANENSIDNLRCRPRAGGAGTGASMTDARGITIKNSDFEPATATGITGISIDATSREIELLNNWIENNATGLSIASGATRIKLTVNSITSNTTDISNSTAVGAVSFDMTSRTGTTISNGVFSVPTGANLIGSSITQNDTTNNPTALSVTNAGTGADVLINGTSTGNIITGQASGSTVFSVASSGMITSTLSTEQLRLAYDSTHYYSFTVSSAGNMTATSTGGTLFTFSNNIVSAVGSTSVAFQSTSTLTNSNFATGSNGSPVTTTAGLLFGGASTINYRTFLNGSSSTTMGVNNSYGALVVGSAPITTPATGTNAVLANMVINPIGTITSGGASITNSASLYINGAGSGATNNYALWVPSGTSKFDGDVQMDKTITAGGTTGAQTINKNAGSVNFAATNTTLVVTDSLATANSIIMATTATNDTTCSVKDVEHASGSFTIRMTAACTAETRVDFLVIN